MKRINMILFVLILILLILIAIKICNQESIETTQIESGISKEEIEYELKREILYGETGEYSTFNSDGERINTSKEINNIKEVESGVEVKNFNISYKDNYTSIIIQAKNTSNEVKGDYTVDLAFFNSKNEEILILKAYLNSVEPNEETYISTSIHGDISDVYRCEIRKVKENNNE